MSTNPGGPTLVISDYKSYLQVAGDSCDSAILYARVRDQNKGFAKNREQIKPWSEACSQTYRASLVTVVFSALSLESFANYIGHLRLDSYFLQAFDRLTTPQKFVVYCKHALNKEFDRSQNVYAELVWLFRLRNEIVHGKTQSMTVEQFMEDRDIADEVHARRSIAAVKSSVQYLATLDSTLHCDWADYQEPVQGEPSQ